MPIAFDASGATFGTSVSSVTTPSWTISGTDRCMVGALMMWHPGVSIYQHAVMRWGGAGGTDFIPFGTKHVHISDTMALWTMRLIAPTVMTSTLYGEIIGSPVMYLCVGAANYTGVDQTTPLGTPVDSPTNGASGNPSISVTIADGEWALGLLHADEDVITPAGSQNQRWEVEGFSASGDDRTGSGPVTLSWTISNSYQQRYLARAVALKPAAGGGQAFTLTADDGSYAVNGTAALLLFGREVQADGGSYIITGTDASLLFGRKVQADGWSYAINGIDASLLLRRRVQAESGSYLITGTDASFIYTGTNRTLVADPGSYIFTGTDASLMLAWLLSAGAGVYAFSGQTVNLLRGYLLTADGGSYVVNGAAANFLRTYLLSANVGIYTIQGRTVELAYSAAPTPSGNFLIFLRRRRRD